jgi:hypothetical protein
VTTFREAFLRARRRVEQGEDPETVVPAVIQLAEAQEEIEMAGRLYGDEDADGEAEG